MWSVCSLYVLHHSERAKTFQWQHGITPMPSLEIAILGDPGADRESLNGRKNVARRKVKNGEKSPWGQCLTRPVPSGRRRSAFWLGRKTQTFSGTNQKSEMRRPFGTGLVRHCPQGLLLFFVPYFFARLDFPSPALSAPGSPRMFRAVID